MPSPFPGMDPYLEGSRWSGVHGQLIAEMVRLLSPALRPRYVAIMNERVVVELPPESAAGGGLRYPYGSVFRTGVAQAGAPGGGGVATAVAGAPLRLATAMEEAIPHFAVEIRDVAQQRLVTAIEVLSPTNKRGDGRTEYLSKRRRMLRSDAHLIEVDLLRGGQRIPMRQPLPDAPYFAFVSRAPDRPFIEVWPVALDQRLPTIPVPLRPGDADVRLDLQQALTNVYEMVGYDLILDYRVPPEVSLTAEESRWVATHVRQSRSGN